MASWLKAFVGGSEEIEDIPEDLQKMLAQAKRDRRALRELLRRSEKAQQILLELSDPLAAVQANAETMSQQMADLQARADTWDGISAQLDSVEQRAKEVAETQSQADAMVREGIEAGMSEDQVQERQAGLFDEAQGRAKSSLKTNFILTEIAEKEEFKIENSDMLQRVTLMAKQAKKPVKGFMKELQKNGQLGNIRQNMLFSKAIDFLVEHATVTEVEPETEEK
jgi:hypothetical protein